MAKTSVYRMCVCVSGFSGDNSDNLSLQQQRQQEALYFRSKSGNHL